MQPSPTRSITPARVRALTVALVLAALAAPAVLAAPAGAAPQRIVVGYGTGPSLVAHAAAVASGSDECSIGADDEGATSAVWALADCLDPSAFGWIGGAGAVTSESAIIFFSLSELGAK